MPPWHITQKDLKRYPHFDAVISAAFAMQYVTTPERVVSHSFYPFIHYALRWTKFAKRGAVGDVKERPIRYAARLDSYIFSYYRHLLSERYEASLAALKLSDAVLAYRRIPIPGRPGNKSNINFAADAVRRIRELGDCCVIALDIKSFFDSLDHTLLKERWASLLDSSSLPADHFKVFRALSNYSVVDKIKAYERLGYFGLRPSSALGMMRPGYITPFREIPTRLCSAQDFRTKIAGSRDLSCIIEKNGEEFGIPQGAPLSDVLANLYMLRFDDELSGHVHDASGSYYRYSDDILIILPGAEPIGAKIIVLAKELLGKFGSRMHFKESKSSMFLFRRTENGQKCNLIEGTHGKNGLEYLGFRFDGTRVYLRDSTITNLRRKVAAAGYRAADAHAKRYPDRNLRQLKSTFNYESFLKRFGRVEDFAETRGDHNKWTFWTYASRASREFGLIGRSIKRQLRNHEKLVKWRLGREIESAVRRRDRKRVAKSVARPQSAQKKP